MKRRVTRVAVTAVAAALIAFALPLVVVSRAFLYERAYSALDVAALAAARTVSGTPVTDPIELPAPSPPTKLAVYDLSGRVVAGDGPSQAGALARAALTGTPGRGLEGGRVTLVVPVVNNEEVVAVVEASVGESEVWGQVLLAWGMLACGVVVTLTIGVAVARLQTRALVRPLDDLIRVAAGVREGDLSCRAQPSEIPEFDQLAQSHNEMVAALAENLERERRFSADASHQLRTPLTRLRLRLEAAQESDPTLSTEWTGAAIADTISLQQTIDDVLTLARGESHSDTASRQEPLGDVLQALADRWHGPLAQVGRRLMLDADTELADLAIGSRIVGHIGDVLIDNALVHGSGVVTITARQVTDAIAVDVADEGSFPSKVPDPFVRGLTTGDGAGLGLALARTMASSIDGRLILAQRSPTVFTLFVPDRR